MVTDSAGNTSTLPSSKAVTDKVDATGPAVSLTQSAPSGWSRVTSDTITVGATDATSGVASVTLTEDGNAVTLSNGKFTDSALADGVHTFKATVTDNAGNVTTKSITDMVDHNGTPSIGQITTTPGTNGQASFGFSVTDLINGSAVPNGPAIDHFTYWIDKNAVDTSIPASSRALGLSIGSTGSATDAITANVSNLSGDYFHVEAVDMMGHTSAIANSKKI